MIIDSHCHAGLGDGITAPWNTSAPLDKYVARADRAGITHTVLFAAFHTNFAVANAQVARIVASRPGRFFGYCFVNAVADKGRIRDLVRTAVERYGFVGIKVHRHFGDLTREVCDVARYYRLPVLYDVMGHVSAVEMIATSYPDVQFIIPHIGSFADDWRAHVAAIDQIARHRNVHADSSGVKRFDYLVEAIKRAGAHKMLFGSDGPWLHPGIELAKIRALGLSAADEALVLGGNWLRVTEAARRGRSVGARGNGVRRGAPAVLLPLGGAPHLQRAVGHV